MEWKDAVAHLPITMMCTDKRGRILLLNRDVAGVRVGKSFLKFAASKNDILAVGRAAKESLSDGKPREVKRAESVSGEAYEVALIPFGVTSARSDHLLVVLRPPGGEGSSGWRPTRSTKANSVPTPRESELDESVPVRFTNGKPQQAGAAEEPKNLSVSEVKSVPAREVIVIPSPSVEPFARSCTTILQRRVKARLWPLDEFERSLSQRSKSGTRADLDTVVSEHTRLLFLGRSEYMEAVASGSGASRGGMGAHWKIMPGRVRRAAIWTSEMSSAGGDIDEVLGDLQYELGQMSMKAIPIKSQRGIAREVDPGVELAGAYLEAPGSKLSPRSTVKEQADEQRILYAIALFLANGLESLVS